MATKSSQYAAVLEQRILHGDYDHGDLPTEQEFAEQVGVSRSTARKALLHLVDKGILERKPHHRPTVNTDYRRIEAKARMAVLTPAFTSGQYDRWMRVTQRCAAACDVSMRIMYFVHWDDPIILQALRSYDGVFLVPNSEPIPERLLEQFGEAGNLVALDSDLTKWQVPSIQTFPPAAAHSMGDYLFGLGHRRIDCLNTQPRDRVIDGRLQQWEFWKAATGVQGEMHDAQVTPYEQPTIWAYETMSRLLDAGEFDATALVCTTDATSQGAIRALHDRGWTIGQDVSVCAIDSSEFACFAVPSRTTFRPVQTDRYIETCMRWLAERETEWQGPLMILPGMPELFKGESTGEAPRS